MCSDAAFKAVGTAAETPLFQPFRIRRIKQLFLNNHRSKCYDSLMIYFMVPRACQQNLNNLAATSVSSCFHGVTFCLVQFSGKNNQSSPPTVIQLFIIYCLPRAQQELLVRFSSYKPISEDLRWTIVRMARLVDLDVISVYTEVSRC